MEKLATGGGNGEHCISETEIVDRDLKEVRHGGGRLSDYVLSATLIILWTLHSHTVLDKVPHIEAITQTETKTTFHCWSQSTSTVSEESLAMCTEGLGYEIGIFDEEMMDTVSSSPSPPTSSLLRRQMPPKAANRAAREFSAADEANRGCPYTPAADSSPFMEEETVMVTGRQSKGKSSNGEMEEKKGVCLQITSYAPLSLHPLWDLELPE
ncbi:hypothetical protein QJS10_CPB15g01679 [Acorus calamus]|uniref:Uncharacterized protein n=1 Tax=Acorus calamus TaxID=4465 RepID=A0AAV9D4Y2_ACOCL|nr:hypothetical protein QJS10_CPB15g01679 [Acorus calamus]